MQDYVIRNIPRVTRLVTNTVIPQETVKAYQETEYHIFGTEDIILKIGQEDTRLEKYGNCAFITPCNPLGQSYSKMWNLAMVKNFECMLELHDVQFVLAYSFHPVSKHPENGLFVYNISREDAISYGKWYRQNAIVFCQDCVPELILLR